MMRWGNKSKNKYKAQKINRDGRWFDSKAEASLYDLLKSRENAKVISNLQCQVQVHLTDAKILYKPDFEFIDHEGNQRFAEFKGVRTASWRIKRKLWMFYGPAPLEVWVGSYHNIKLDEVIVPKA